MEIKSGWTKALSFDSDEHFNQSGFIFPQSCLLDNSRNSKIVCEKGSAILLALKNP